MLDLLLFCQANKFIQIEMSMTAHTSKSKPEIEFQNWRPAVFLNRK